MSDNDILLELDQSLDELVPQKPVNNLETLYTEHLQTLNETPIFFHYTTIVEAPEKKSTLFSHIWFLMKYLSTCTVIFAILLVGTNYSAYFTIAKSYLMKDEVEKQQQSLLTSVQAASIHKNITKTEENQNENKDQKHTEIEDDSLQKTTSSIKKYKKELDAMKINMDIEITPYENRVVIPKIGKNVPLIDIKNRTLNNEGELDNIFMKELEKGIVRYPGSAVPGEIGNTFIFGHSSNFPWMEGDYNDVFATLGNIEMGDEVIVYYNQKKYIYKITEKQVITPGDVSVLNRNHNKKEISIMTCWPIGTTYNRLLVTGELIEK
ncbi:sortase [Candidatus Gracilibacteria bacterium]|nr:sortase [Candidatus Gracilibacteria bacterium]